MKHILYGISLILFGFSLIFVSFISETQMLDLVGLIFTIIGFVQSTYGFFKKEH